ncbi:hypothetical protein [Hymenobacter sp. BT491]|uniref:hypothetical protein n=1 Tax=Hymenobacter sp. BT491 TaxID=2766779 RepID=UPI00165387B1|nr:hypothetical protein [Hymenobacter sp. BT491]MBC6989250.1 hypothetical protein [Hymenobacter sp. BT491]
MSTIEEKEYWKIRAEVRQEITATRTELLELITKKSILERRLEQAQQRMAGLNRSLLNEDYYIKLSTLNSEIDEPGAYDANFSVAHEPIPFHHYRDAGEGDDPIAIFGQERTIEGFRQEGFGSKGMTIPQRTGRFIVSDSGKMKYRLYDEIIARLHVADPAGFRAITTKDSEGQILINGEFGVVPCFDEAASGRIYTSEAAYFQALSRYYMFMAKMATMRSRPPEQHLAVTTR